ncbi:response regulator [Pseudoduganella chitinolytica]|uniref:Response regulator n=1 Tax=Pseudoduganella chitinolytica TaxID=34070 RepID=A0ABY8BIC7_9BURK|nr:response regulator [Pseudoduganella chitinolytica]WEF35697.1 response regulator [Pseudoduganella chitinolytica]
MKVLVVDDDVVSRMMLMHLIDSSGSFDITEAEDGADAWRQLSAGLRPAICFCDLRMPRLSGMDLLQHVRADPALADLPFVLVSSAGDRATVQQATQAGASGYIVKPFEAEHVRAHLARLLGGAGQALPAEDPAVTQARLGIDARRLQAYLAGFEQQLTAAPADIGALLERGDHQGAQARLERLAAGCATLGLHGALAALRGLQGTAPAPARLQQVLADVAAAVQRQAGLVAIL